MKPGWLFLLVLVGVGCQKPPPEPVASTPANAPQSTSPVGAEAPVSTRPPSPTPPALSSQGGTESAPAPAAPAANPSEKAWKVKPTPLSVIKADPPSYLGKPTLVFVAVKPTDYFNYGYRDARNSHFAFEMRPALENGQTGPEKLYGYAARSWARPFFNEVNQRLGMFVLARDADKKNYVTATLVVAYSKKRYDGRSADHIEILSAEVGEKLDMDPQVVVSLREQRPESAQQGGDCDVWQAPPPRYCKTYPRGTTAWAARYLSEHGVSLEQSQCFLSGQMNRNRYNKDRLMSAVILASQPSLIIDHCK